MKSTVWMAMMVLAPISWAGTVFAADSPGELLKSYRSAHEANSIEQVEKLVHFRTQDPARRATWLRDVAANFSSKIASIKLIPFKESAFTLPESELKRLPPTLKPTSWLAIDLASRQTNPGRTESTNYLVAVEDGKYFIVGP